MYYSRHYILYIHSNKFTVSITDTSTFTLFKQKKCLFYFEKEGVYSANILGTKLANLIKSENSRYI